MDALNLSNKIKLYSVELSNHRIILQNIYHGFQKKISSITVFNIYKYLAEVLEWFLKDHVTLKSNAILPQQE